MISKLMVISYDLRPDATPKDYAQLASGLSSLGATRLLLSLWALRTSLTPAALVEAIGPYLDADRDHLLVVEVAAHAEMNTTPSLAAL